MPTTTLGDRKYPTLAAIEALFTTAGNSFVRVDGVVNFRIKSRLRRASY
jgi:hypothetical protein